MGVWTVVTAKGDLIHMVPISSERTDNVCPNFAVLFIFALKKKTSYPSKKIVIILSHEYSALLSLVWLLWTNSIKPLIISWLELVLECGPSDSNFSRVCRHDKEQLKSRHGWRDVVYLLINNTALNIYGIGAISQTSSKFGLSITLSMSFRLKNVIYIINL